MTAKTRTIEIDEATATALKEHADERGITVPDLLVEFLDAARAPADVDDAQIAELDRRWAEIKNGQPTVANEQVVRWLETWGTPAFKPWQDQ